MNQLMKKKAGMASVSKLPRILMNASGKQFELPQQTCFNKKHSESQASMITSASGRSKQKESPIQAARVYRKSGSTRHI